MILVGKNRAEYLLAHARGRPCLVIADGPLIDEFKASDKRKYTELDLTKDSFNIMAGMNYERAIDTLSILDHAFPGGATTLRRQDSNYILLNALAPKKGSPPKTLKKLLYRLIPPTSKALDYKDAYQKIDTILLSPVLERVFCKPSTFTMRGIILARIDRTKYAGRDCKLLANFLMARYKGHIIVDDFGFYACPFHDALIRENRLTVGVNRLNDVSDQLRDLLLLSGEEGHGCIFDDATYLADSAGFIRGTNEYHDEIERLMK